VSGVLAWHAFRFVADAYRFNDTVLGNLPAWAFQLVMPVGFSLISFQFLLTTLRVLRRNS
jgi:TRAP-type C4-dicarboxylate transport system permease small subunit